MPGIISNLTTMQEQSYATARSSDFSADLPSGVVHSTGEWVESTPITLNGKATRWCIRGKYDFLMQYDNGTWGIIDTKFSGTLDDKARFYSPQIEAYTFALESPCVGSPRHVSTVGLMVWKPTNLLGTHADGFSINLERAYQPLDHNQGAFAQHMANVVTVLDGDMPAPGDKCPYCTWLSNRTT